MGIHILLYSFFFLFLSFSLSFLLSFWKDYGTNEVFVRALLEAESQDQVNVNRKMSPTQARSSLENVSDCQWSISSYEILSLLFISFQVFDPTSYSILVPKPINHLPHLSLPFSLSLSFYLSSSLSSSLDLLSFLLISHFFPLSLTLSFSPSLPLSLLRLEWPSSDHF